MIRAADDFRAIRTRLEELQLQRHAAEKEAAHNTDRRRAFEQDYETLSTDKKATTPPRRFG